MWQPVVALLRSARSVYLAAHVSPDGDALGSLLGLGWALTALGKTCTLACADPVPPWLTFLPGSDRIVAERVGDQDVIIVLDTGDIGRMGSLYAAEVFAGRPIINIDHHETNTRFGTINIIDAEAAAVGEMAYDLVRELGVALDKTIATCLLSALVTDTVSFRTSSTTPRTLRYAADFMEAGASMAEVVQQAFESRPVPVLRLWGKVLSSFEMNGGLVWAAISRQDMQDHGLQEDDVKGLVNVLRGTEGARVAVLLMEVADGKVKAEFRSRGGVNVAQIAAALGGGGHRAAAGCTLAGSLAQAERRVLVEVRKRL